MHARGRCYGLPECIVVDVVLVTPRRTAGKTTVPSVCSSQAGSHVKCRESSSGQRAGEVRAANQAGSVHRKNDPGLALVEGRRRWDAYGLSRWTARWTVQDALDGCLRAAVVTIDYG